MLWFILGVFAGAFIMSIGMSILMMESDDE